MSPVGGKAPSASCLSFPSTAGQNTLTRCTSLFAVSRCLSLGPTMYRDPLSSSQLFPEVTSSNWTTPSIMKLASTWFLYHRSREKPPEKYASDSEKPQPSALVSILKDRSDLSPSLRTISFSVPAISWCVLTNMNSPSNTVAAHPRLLWVRAATLLHSLCVFGLRAPGLRDRPRGRISALVVRASLHRRAAG